MPTPSSAARPGSDQQALLDQLVQLTTAVKQLAERDGDRRPDVDAVPETDRVRQRVAFGYQALGALMGRESPRTGADFDVRVVTARREGGLVVLDGLPARARWVELRSGATVEVARIQRDDDVDADAAAGDDDGPGRAGGRDAAADAGPVSGAGPDADARRRSRRGVVRPELFGPTDPVGAVLVLRSRRGPVVALGPRLGPVAPTTPSTSRTSS